MPLLRATRHHRTRVCFDFSKPSATRSADRPEAIDFGQAARLIDGVDAGNLREEILPGKQPPTLKAVRWARPLQIIAREATVQLRCPGDKGFPTGAGSNLGRIEDRPDATKGSIPLTTRLHHSSAPSTSGPRPPFPPTVENVRDVRQSSMTSIP
jgi:hypothetical protein